ncbi:hypothetical protein V8D89_005060 [Ganoderma adspersum]
MPKMSQDASRLQRLRQYSSKFASGSFDYEDFGTHHHDYVLQQLRILRWNTTMPADSSFSNLYSQDCRSDLALSIFTPGSAQAGIQSSHCLIHIGTAGEPGLVITKWAIDDAQDLLVIAEVADIAIPERLRRRRDEYVVWELAVRHGDRPDLSFCVEVCNWRTGEVISALGAPQDDSNSKSDCESEERKMVGVIEDIEAVLPGVIDRDCSSIPYLAYRFKIELPDAPLKWELGDAQVIRAVVMAMTGFTFVGVEHEKAVQTWTV